MIDKEYVWVRVFFDLCCKVNSQPSDRLVTSWRFHFEYDLTSWVLVGLGTRRSGYGLWILKSHSATLIRSFNCGQNDLRDLDYLNRFHDLYTSSTRHSHSAIFARFREQLQRHKTISQSVSMENKKKKRLYTCKRKITLNSFTKGWYWWKSNRCLNNHKHSILYIDLISECLYGQSKQNQSCLYFVAEL